MSRKTKTIYPKKTVQGTYYITREAADKMRKAMRRAGERRLRLTQSDVINECLMKHADLMTAETVGPVTSADTAGG